ncbi:porin [Moraxella bovoculi]|uniref:porin n=1 Tax=Moraxella bovoculi TaxID=386891 RepID=UPI0009BBD75E|nr:porin [Moraxella bovoculi]
MKKSLLATAIKTSSVLAIAALSTAAYAAPEVYGQVRLSLTYNDIETKVNGIVDESKTSKRPELGSGNSRLGFRGKEALTENTDLEYRLEYRIDVAENSDTNFSARHGYLALNNKQYGKLLAGRTISQDDYLDVSESWWRVAGGGYDFGHGAAWVNNTVVYSTPKFNNDKTYAFVQYGMDEGKDGARSFHTFEDGVAKSVSRDFMMLGAIHQDDKTYAGFTYTQAGNDLKSARGSVSYQATDKIKTYGILQYTDFNSDDNELAAFAGVAYKLKEPTTVWLEGYHSDNYKGYSNGESSGGTIGVKHNVNKNLTGFASLGFKKAEYDKTKVDGKGIEIGTIYRF